MTWWPYGGARAIASLTRRTPRSTDAAARQRARPLPGRASRPARGAPRSDRARRFRRRDRAHRRHRERAVDRRDPPAVVARRAGAGSRRARGTGNPVADALREAIARHAFAGRARSRSCSTPARARSSRNSALSGAALDQHLDETEGAAFRLAARILGRACRRSSRQSCSSRQVKPTGACSSCAPFRSCSQPAANARRASASG